MTPFNHIQQIPKSLLAILDTHGFQTMTPIQAKAIPLILDKQDLLAQSKTGSGKTVAFGLPAVMQTDTSNQKPQILVVTPTRELAEQVATELRKLAAYKPNLKIVTLYGGVPLRAQADSLQKGAHIIVGTPGRLMDHLGKGTLWLGDIKMLILDEADRMLEMGFYDDIVKIASHLPKQRQTLLFSATFPPKIEQLATTLMHKPQSIKIDTKQEAGKITERVYVTSHKEKTLTEIIETYQPASMLLFCNTKADVITLSHTLQKQGHAVITLHGDMDQNERNEAIILFANGSRPLMVATDVASRGLDIDDIELIVNYDLPFDEEVYTHRIGRTGRADATGTAVSLYAPGSRKTDYILDRAEEMPLSGLKHSGSYRITSSYETIGINGGKRTKLRAGDILGTFCKEIGIDNSHIGKITVTDNRTYVALERESVNRVLDALGRVKIKKKKYKAWVL